MRRTAVLVVALVLLAVSGAAPAGAQAATEFQPISDFDLIVDDTPDLSAKMLQANSPTTAILVISDQLPSPVLLTPSTTSVQAVPLLRLVPQPSGRIRLLRGSELRSLGGFRVSAEGISFSYGDVMARLEQRRPLVGEATMEEIFEHSPDYRLTADQYRPDEDIVGLLRGVGEGYRVRVVYGSWCHVCKNFLPRGLKVQEALGDAGIEFTYYGLPRNPWEPPHPEVARLDVRSLPTAIVYQGDKEIGRYAGGDEWQRPESKLWAAIQKTKK